MYEASKTPEIQAPAFELVSYLWALSAKCLASTTMLRLAAVCLSDRKIPEGMF